MSIKTILLHLASDENLDSRVEAALGIATQNNAALVGVYSIPPITPPTSFMGYIPPEYTEQTLELENKKALACKAKLEELAARVNVPVSVIIEEGYAPDVVNKYALTADLVVVGQVDPQKSESAPYLTLINDLVVSCARPILAIPYAGNFKNFGDHILVGWNNTRESSRAIHEAMPFLKAGKKVTLLSINPSKDQSGPDAAMLAHLERHGVKAECKVGHWKDVSAGNAMLDSLVDYSADMLVMGAYGHSRIREMILGGATQEILDHMTAPVLFAH
ncbi:universal stress protein [Sneathiella chinensis]|uniref:Universal stress protein A n=1 Tax=Sneathiella chinensis TaxID=349750 RepID=A0ABQ5U3A7_9PROT|nr:universal stress protein [Sneathiella chinensis]GLQ06196.1 universal stress protein A [Sneathiella chinensis]